MRERRTTSRTKTWVTLLLAASVTWGAAGAAAQTPEPTNPAGEVVAPSVTLPPTTRENPFAGFETYYLANGMKLWFNRLRGAPNVTASVVVPYGRDRDLKGREQLAHFTEHMLFSDHDGRSEREIKNAVEGLGGIRNGVTYNDRTFYFVTIGNEYGLFAIEWLSRIMSPHDMDQEVVERSRQPVAVEINSRPRELFEHVGAALNPDWLLPAPFWEREFGLRGRAVMHDPWVSLHDITAEDLRGFYDQYYAPAAMTLTIVGDLDPDQVLDLAERTFGTFPSRDVAPLGYELTDPGRARTTSFWGFGSDIGYDRRYKLFNPSAEDQLYVLFIRDLLGRRLNQRLRYGERKAAYGVATTLIKRGPAAYLRLGGDINEDEYDYAVQVFDEELAQLRAGSIDPSAFEEDRRAIIERLRTSNLTTEALSSWPRNYFYDPNVFDDFPDVLGFYAQVDQQALAAFVNRTLVADRELGSVTYLQPVSQGVMLFALILLVTLTHRGVSGMLTRPIEMKTIRYIARFRTALLIRFVRVIVFAGLGLILGRLVIAGLIWAGSAWVVTIDNYVLQTTSWALMLSGSIALVVLYLAWFPRKLLVFPDHIRVKSRAYSARVLRPEDIAEISLRRFRDVWLSTDIVRCTALAFGLLGPGLYIRPKKGRALFFRTRDTMELTELLGEWRGAPVCVTANSGGPRRAPNIAVPPERGGRTAPSAASGKSREQDIVDAEPAPITVKPTPSVRTFDDPVDVDQ